jgi:hypothetical protein
MPVAVGHGYNGVGRGPLAIASTAILIHTAAAKLLDQSDLWNRQAQSMVVFNQRHHLSQPRPGFLWGGGGNYF